MTAGHDHYWAHYTRLLQMLAFLLGYPFARRLYPRALEAVAHLGTLGLSAVFSDGDVVFQPRKIQRSGIWDAVTGRVPRPPAATFQEQP